MRASSRSLITLFVCVLSCLDSLHVLAATSGPSLHQSLSIAVRPTADNDNINARWQKAVNLAALEQSVEDYNAEYIASSATHQESLTHRRLLVLPLDDEAFNPPVGVFSHGHIQTGDKVSLPTHFWPAIQANNAQVPWLFSISRIPGVTSDRVEWKDDGDDNVGVKSSSILERGDKSRKNTQLDPHRPLRSDINTVVAGPLDFRAPPCYVFLPLWMMRALGVRPLDVVQVELCKDTYVASGSMAKLRPLTNDFAKEIANPQAVLETELRHYSSLTQGTVIAFDYNNKRYWFQVVELLSTPKGEKVDMIKVQDCDIATDFLPSLESKLQQQQKKKQQQEEL